MKNILLLAMSTLPGDIENDKYYQYPNGDIIPARSQLEPITHMLSEQQKLDKIIILETMETLKPDEKKGGKSAVNFYKERVDRFAKEIEYVDILINGNEPAEGIRKAITIILQDYREQKEKGETINFWIDTQGGLRDIVMVLNAIVSLLGEQGIEPRGIYSIQYSDKSTKENPSPILDQTKKYDIFKFVSSMQEFIDFGKATGLKKYYGEENDFVQAIDGIADAIQMCQPQKFEDALQRFADYLKAENYKETDPYLQIFVEFIKSDYGSLLVYPNDTVEQIRWCVRKEFYQQAITIYIEKIPRYYHKQGIITLKVEENEKTNGRKNLYADAFYTELFEEMVKDKKDEQLENILYEAKTKGNGLNDVVKYLRSEEKKKDLDPIVQAAIHKLIDWLNERFDASGRKKKGKNTGPKTIQEYIDNKCGAKNRGNRLELLYGKTKTINKDKDDKYGRKIRAIEEAKNKKPEIVKMMEYYLAMKLLRNRMNHASEEEIKEDEKKAIEFLKSEQVDIGIEVKQGEIDLNYQKIKKLIIDGLECMI